MDTESSEAGPRSVGAMAWSALRPFSGGIGPSEEEAVKFALVSILMGFGIGVPGVALGAWLSAAERSAANAALAPGTTYPSLVKIFMLPAMYGLLIAFVGTYSGITTRVPWLETRSIAAIATRMIVALILLNIFIVAGIGILFVAFG